jgi:hypothetical protein
MTKRTDIMGALKTAKDKGISLDLAKRSLVNAGYDKQDIEDSAQAFSAGESPYEKPAKKPLPTLPGVGKKTPAQPAQQTPAQAQGQQATTQKKKTSVGVIIAIVFAAIAMAGSLGYLLYTMLLG